MTTLHALYARARNRRRYTVHLVGPADKRVACGKPRARRTTRVAWLVTCLACKLLLAGCGDDLVPPKPDAGVRMDACDPTIDRTCMPELHDAGAKP